MKEDDVHKAQTIVTPSMKENLCNSNHCREELYDPRCFRCYTVRTKCPICKSEHTFPLKDPDRADMFVKVVPLETWECPDCSAKRVKSTTIKRRKQDRRKQTTLGGF